MPHENYLQETLNISGAICLVFKGCCNVAAKCWCCNELPNFLRWLAAPCLYCFNLALDICSGSLDSELSGVSLDTDA